MTSPTPPKEGLKKKLVLSRKTTLIRQLELKKLVLSPKATPKSPEGDL